MGADLGEAFGAFDCAEGSGDLLLELYHARRVWVPEDVPLGVELG